MPRFIKKRSEAIGLAPGTLVHIGEKKIEKVRIRLIDYDAKHIEEKEVQSIEECFPFKETPTVTWVNIDGLHEVEVIERLGEHFNIHPLVLEDIANTGQRPKMEDFENYVFVVLKMLFYDEKEGGTHAEQFSLILGPHWVLTFQERVGDVFEPVRERLRKGKGLSRKSGPDYLATVLLDAIVDNYFTILENLGEKIELMEEKLVGDPTPQTLQTIHTLKKEMIFLRKSVWPLREVISGIERGESPLIKKQTRAYIKDLYDHTIQVIDTVETFRDMVSGMLDIYLSSVSNKMNEVMKVLTIMATIFIPLTFMAGIYGMNFEYMPELKWKFSYPLFWVALIAVALVMLMFFRRKKWL
jgi:magnesium transporter